MEIIVELEVNNVYNSNYTIAQSDNQRIVNKTRGMNSKIEIIV